MKQLILVAMAFNSLAVAASASIELTTDRLSGGVTTLADTASGPVSPQWLAMTAGGVSGDNMTVRISSDSADEMFGWQVSLLIVGADASTGTVEFNSAVVPGDYIFGSASAFFSSETDGGGTSAKDSLVGFDMNFSGGLSAVSVTEAGANLLSLDFLASGDASGWFGVFAQPAGLSEWTDGSLAPQGFSNISGSNTLIGLIHVDAATGVVPEPSSFIIWFGLAAFVAHIRRRRLRR